jgi:hypothetical protein
MFAQDKPHVFAIAPENLLLTGNPSQGKRQTLPQIERLENNFPSKWSKERSQSCHSNIE